VYYKKAFPAEWEARTEEANQKWMKPGSAEEVAQILRSVRSKDYDYKCSDMPLCTHCDRATCEGREFGVSSLVAEMPKIEGMTKMMTKPPAYFLTVAGVRLGPLSSQDLLLQARFQQAVYEAVNLVIPTLKTGQWKKLLQEVSDQQQVMEVPNDSSAEGQLFQHLEEFVSGPACSTDKDLLLARRVWESKDADCRYFRMGDFMDHLERRRFKEYKVTEVTALLKEAGISNKRFKVKGTNVSCWGVTGLILVDKLNTPTGTQEPF